MILTFKYALDPSHAQKDKLSSHIGAVRFAYNWALNYVETNWDERKAQERAGIPEDERTPWVNWSAYNLRKVLNDAKAEIAPWWNENSKEAFATGTANFSHAINRWNDSKKGKIKGSKVGFPQPKKKWRDTGAGVRFTTGTMRLELSARHLTLPRIGTIRLHETASQLGKFLAAGARIRSISVNFAQERWFASLSVEVPDELALTHFKNKVNGRKKKASVGADQGLKTRLFLSDGGEVENPRHLVKAQKKLRRLNKRLSRRREYNKTTGEAPSNRYEKARADLAKQNAKTANQRRDFLDKLTTWLVMEYAFIGLEKLNTAGMLKNGKLAKHIADAGFYEFVRQLKYKAGRYGSTVVLISQWFPSSKKCSGCGEVKATLSLSEREYKCGSCGAVFDRDHNAAINIEAEAWRVFAESIQNEITAGASCAKALNERGGNSSGLGSNTLLKLSPVKRSELGLVPQSQRSAREGATRGALL